MPVTPLPVLDRMAATFKADTDRFFGSQLPTFSTQINQLVADVDASKSAAATSAANAAASAAAASGSAQQASTSKNAAASSATNAATSETNASASKNAAATSATAAAASATVADQKAQAAAVYAQQAIDAVAGVADGPVTSVNGKTGVVTLAKADLALGNVNNTADKDKPVSDPQLAMMHAVALLF